MCWTRTTSYIICAHPRTAKQHCENYLSKPRKKCEKLCYNDTVLALCPRCSRTSPKPPLIPLLAFSQKPGIEPAKSSPATSSEDPKEGGELSATNKTLSGLRWMIGSVRRSERSDMKGKYIGTEVQPQRESPRTSTNAAQNVRSSEQLADEYRGIIGCHPDIAPSIYGRAGVATAPKSIDIETCTTWSRFLPKSESLTQRTTEGVKTLSKEDQNGPGNVDFARSEVTRTHEVIEQRGAKNKAIPLDPARTEELKKAEEKVARVRDGRGAMHFG